MNKFDKDNKKKIKTKKNQLNFCVVINFFLFMKINLTTCGQIEGLNYLILVTP
jgi:hypothetical protein